MVLDVLANMKSKLILFTPLMRVPGFIMSNSLVHVVLKKKLKMYNFLFC